MEDTRALIIRDPYSGCLFDMNAISRLYNTNYLTKNETISINKNKYHIQHNIVYNTRITYTPC